MGAIIHDIVQIQNNGIKVKTNFSLSYLDLLAVLTIGSLLDYKQGDNKKMVLDFRQKDHKKWKNMLEASQNFKLIKNPDNAYIF